MLADYAIGVVHDRANLIFGDCCDIIKIAKITSIPNEVREERLKNKNNYYCRHESIPSTPLSADSTSPLSPTSAYFTTSEGKARFLTRYSRDVTVEGLTRQEDVPPIIPTNSLDLRQKKVYHYNKITFILSRISFSNAFVFQYCLILFFLLFFFSFNASSL